MGRVGDAPVPGGVWQEEGRCYFGSCKALTFLSQKTTEKNLSLCLCFLAVPVQQQGNAGAQTPAVVMQDSASAGEKRDIPVINGKHWVEEVYFPICINFTF